MEDTRIKFETAKLAKGKGFHQEPNKRKVPYYNYKGEFKGDVTDYIRKYLRGEDTSNVESVSAPTQSLLAKWLREEHNIHINVFCDYDRKDETYNTYWNCNIILLNWGDDREQYVTSKIRNFNNKFEEAYEIGLQEALKLIDNK